MTTEEFVAQAAIEVYTLLRRTTPTTPEMQKLQAEAAWHEAELLLCAAPRYVRAALDGVST